MGQRIGILPLMQQKAKAAERFLCKRGFQCPGQLVRAGSAAAIAIDALQFCNYFPGIHALCQFCNALGIPMAAADKGYMTDLSILNVKLNLLGTNSPGLISIHNFPPFLKECGRNPISLRQRIIIKIFWRNVKYAER